MLLSLRVFLFIRLPGSDVTTKNANILTGINRHVTFLSHQISYDFFVKVQGNFKQKKSDFHSLFAVVRNLIRILK